MEVHVNKQNLIDIANSLRTKKGEPSTKKYKVSEMAEGIDDIETGIIPSGTLEITENGTYDVTEKASVDVDVSGELGTFVVPNGMKFAYSSNLANNLDFSNVIDMQNMFSNCSNVNLSNFDNFDTSNVTNMQNMFYNCTVLVLTSFNTSKVTRMVSMFYSCNITTIPQFDTSKVENMNGMFNYCRSLTTIPQLDTRNVTDMGSMFRSCSNITTLPVLDTSNVTNMNNMFQYAYVSDEDVLNNILAMCINAVKITSSNKTLKYIGLSSSQATTCQGLSNYQAFLDAGWTTGY